MSALNAENLRWPNGTVPSMPLNSTGSVSNLSGNKVVVGTGSDSNVGTSSKTELHKRRSLLVPILRTPDIPPVLTEIG